MKRKQQKLGKNKHQRGKWYEIKWRKNANEPLYTIQDKKKKKTWKHSKLKGNNSITYYKKKPNKTGFEMTEEQAEVDQKASEKLTKLEQ